MKLAFFLSLFLFFLITKRHPVYMSKVKAKKDVVPADSIRTYLGMNTASRFDGLFAKGKKGCLMAKEAGLTHQHRIVES